MNEILENTVDQVHIFERSGLGKAPFRFVAGGKLLVGGSCDYCGMAIRNANKIQSADGKVFKVGSECVNKTGDAGLIRRAKAVINAAARVKRAAKKTQAVADATVTHAALLLQIKSLTDGFAGRFARDLEYRITASGKAPSSKQMELLNKLIAERA